MSALSGPAGVSVLVCTRNRADCLDRSLDAIVEAARRAPCLDVDLIVVDNGSTDGTPAVLERWAAANEMSTKVVREAKPGLARARNAGLPFAEGELIVLTDDDCVMRPDYFINLAKAYAANPAAIIGGRVELGDGRDLPITIKTNPERAAYKPGRKPGGFIMGANMSLHRTVVERVGAFDERFGAGARFIAGEDSDYVLRASILGFPVLYEPSLVVDHYHGRRSPEDGRRLLEGYSYGDGALYAKHMFRSLIPLKVLRAGAMNALREWPRPAAWNPLVGREHSFRFRHNLRGLWAYFTSGLRERGHVRLQRTE